ncbi:hypothetical protein RVR_4426 [Actinacidiphila reveromycinica]|uniref:Uncharacterized protein n=1 Tax=Actinacidiphila reveromycinica TaxID=659352 RepID=A0A7U3VP43_9ACTN|nr:hypothetical protein [Streptomyces sp. SN-593]BBA98293.1 hypothetical protein RVR_4426 [Streptomyces sp. SN-593]
MSTRITVHCNTEWAEGSCPTSLMTDAHTVAEARQAAVELGWRAHPDGRDFCPSCSGTRRSSYTPVVHLHPTRTTP